MTVPGAAPAVTVVPDKDKALNVGAPAAVMVTDNGVVFGDPAAPERVSTKEIFAVPAEADAAPGPAINRSPLGPPITNRLSFVARAMVEPDVFPRMLPIRVPDAVPDANVAFDKVKIFKDGAAVLAVRLKAVLFGDPVAPAKVSIKEIANVPAADETDPTTILEPEIVKRPSFGESDNVEPDVFPEMVPIIVFCAAPAVNAVFDSVSVLRTGAAALIVIVRLVAFGELVAPANVSVSVPEIVPAEVAADPTIRLLPETVTRPSLGVNASVDPVVFPEMVPIIVPGVAPAGKDTADSVSGLKTIGAASMITETDELREIPEIVSVNVKFRLSGEDAVPEPTKSLRPSDDKATRGSLGERVRVEPDVRPKIFPISVPAVAPAVNLDAERDNAAKTIAGLTVIFTTELTVVAPFRVSVSVPTIVPAVAAAFPTTRLEPETATRPSLGVNVTVEPSVFP